MQVSTSKYKSSTHPHCNWLKDTERFGCDTLATEVGQRTHPQGQPASKQASTASRRPQPTGKSSTKRWPTDDVDESWMNTLSLPRIQTGPRVGLTIIATAHRCSSSNHNTSIVWTVPPFTYTSPSSKPQELSSSALLIKYYTLARACVRTSTHRCL